MTSYNLTKSPPLWSLAADLVDGRVILMCAHKKSIRSRDKSQYSMFDSDTQGFYKSEQQESSIMRRSFNPHALQRRAHLLHVGAVYHHEFQSTRPVWGATARAVSLFCHSMFQSTRPVWGATPACTAPPIGLLRFNPRAPCGARLFLESKKAPLP